METLFSLDDARPLECSNDPHPADGIVSHSPALRDALDRLGRVAPIDTTVLLTGETGTGKELMARALHRRSRRAARPFVAVNLAAIPEPLVASELFGHEQGAFTGASQRRIGRFEIADRATLFLDEVGELSADVQVALLRVVQEGEFERLGASQIRRVDVRLITATNRSLDEAVDEGRFRADLFYRLSVFPIHLPPLRERREDIPLLAEFFLRRFASRLRRQFAEIEPASMQRLIAFSWPGNIRQLQNVVEQSAILCDDQELRIPQKLMVERRKGIKTAARLDAALHRDEQHTIEKTLEKAEARVDGPSGVTAPRSVPAPTLGSKIARYNIDIIEQTLKETKGRVSGPSGAAVRLGLPASTLQSKIKRFNIDKLRYRIVRC
jgi:transcriptional regulator with GAF, ATPase, and Fis domain